MTSTGQLDHKLESVLCDSGFEIVSSEQWDQPRRFDEWAAIVAQARSLEALRRLLLALAARAEEAGIALAEQEGEPVFVHRWLLIAAQPRT